MSNKNELLKNSGMKDVDTTLIGLKSILEAKRDWLGGKLDLFFMGDADPSSETKGLFPGKLVVKESENGLVISKMVALVESGESVGEERCYFSENEARTPWESDYLNMGCELVTKSGRNVIIFTTIGPVSLMNSENPAPGFEGLSMIKDKEFFNLVPSGMVIEKIFVDMATGKTSRILTAWLDMEPSEEIERSLEPGVRISFDLRDLYVERNMRKVERGLDGKLIIRDVVLVDGKTIQYNDVNNLLIK